MNNGPLLRIRVFESEAIGSTSPESALELASISHDIYGNAIEIAKSLHEDYQVKDIVPNFNDVDKVVALSGSNESGRELYNFFNEVAQGKSLNKRLVESFRGIQKRIKANGFVYEAEFIVDGKPKTVTQEIKQAKTFHIKRRKTTRLPSLQMISGELISCGGENPNIHIRTQNGIIIVDCTKELTKSLEGRLYENVDLAVIDFSIRPDDAPANDQESLLKARPLLVSHYSKPEDRDFVHDLIDGLKNADKPTRFLMEKTVDFIAVADLVKLTLMTELLSDKRINTLWQKAIVVPLLQYCLHSDQPSARLKNALAKMLESAYPGSPHIEKFK